MTSDNQEASGEVAVVADKVVTAAAVEIAATSKEKLDEMEKLKRSLNVKKISDFKEPEQIGNSN